jgi:hypothetical protein
MPDANRSAIFIKIVTGWLLGYNPPRYGANSPTSTEHPNAPSTGSGQACLFCWPAEYHLFLVNGEETRSRFNLR